MWTETPIAFRLDRAKEWSSAVGRVLRVQKLNLLSFAWLGICLKNRKNLLFLRLLKFNKFCIWKIQKYLGNKYDYNVGILIWTWWVNEFILIRLLWVLYKWNTYIFLQEYSSHKRYVYSDILKVLVRKKIKVFLKKKKKNNYVKFSHHINILIKNFLILGSNNGTF